MNRFLASAIIAAQQEAAACASKARSVMDYAALCTFRGSATNEHCLRITAQHQRDAAEAAYWARYYMGLEETCCADQKGGDA